MASALDVIQVVVEGALLAQRILSVYQFIMADAASDEDVIADLAEYMENALYIELESTLANDYVISNYEFKNLTDNTLMDVVPATIAFTNVGEILPLGVAGLVTANTATPKVRGRKFIPGLTEGSCADSLWGSPTVTVFNSFAAAYIAPFLGAVSGTAYAPGVTSSIGTFRPFTEALVSNIPAYQRRRKQGVGE